MKFVVFLDLLIAASKVVNINVQEELLGYLQCWYLNGIGRSSLDDKF